MPSDQNENQQPAEPAVTEVRVSNMPVAALDDLRVSAAEEGITSEAGVIRWAALRYWRILKAEAAGRPVTASEV
mgnify:CR=1 FL=1